MIRIGLTRFDEHVALTGKSKSSLFEYAGHLPLVELDTAYYAIPRKSTVENWLTQVPADFRFIIKAFSGLTKQKEEVAGFDSEEEMAEAFLAVMQPLIEQNKLFCFLFQFPSYFECTKENVNYLKKIREMMGNVPIAIEFRNADWYSERVLIPMRKFMKDHHFSLGIIDEPQVSNRSVPFDPYVTNTEFTMFRLHGRNQQGWQVTGADWQKKRTLYEYSHEELLELKGVIEDVANKTKEVGVIFNNNSGGHAAGNALELTGLMKLDWENLNPKQLDLF